MCSPEFPTQEKYVTRADRHTETLFFLERPPHIVFPFLGPLPPMPPPALPQRGQGRRKEEEKNAVKRRWRHRGMEGQDKWSDFVFLKVFVQICKANSIHFSQKETLSQTINHMECIAKPSTPVFWAINVGPSANIKATSSLSPLPWRLRRRPELRRERRRLTPPPYTHMPVIQIRPLLKRERETSSHFFTPLTSVQKKIFFWMCGHHFILLYRGRIHWHQNRGVCVYVFLAVYYHPPSPNENSHPWPPKPSFFPRSHGQIKSRRSSRRPFSR